MKGGGRITKVKHFIKINGVLVDAATLPEEEFKKIFHEINVKFMKDHGYVPARENTKETA